MRHNVFVLLALMSILGVMLPVTAHADWYTSAIWTDSPEQGENFGTHDLIRIRWRAWIDWGVWDDPPDAETIHYMVILNDAVLTEGYYDWMDVHYLWGEVSGSFDYRVPGNGYSKNPNSPLTICMDACATSLCEDDFCRSITIGIKTWYDPLPIPQQSSRATLAGPGIESTFLGEPYPNPFNPSTTVTFGLKEAATVSLKIFNLNGQLVRTLRNDEALDAGEYRDSWNGLDHGGNKVSSGVYFLKLTTSSGYSETRKMVLVQ
jgi:hypothetical protein